MREPSTADTRERILKAARATFGSRGFAGTTTREIAKKAGVNEVTVFRHFKSKQALFASAVAEMLPLPDIMEQVSFDGDFTPDEMIRHNVETVLEILKANKHLFMIIIGEGWRHPKLRRSMADSGIETGVQFLSENLEGLMRRGILRKMDPDVAARALIGMVQIHFLTRYLMSARPPTAQEEEAYIKGIVSIFVSGMKPHQGVDSGE